jgi:hypothetical protein
MPDDIDLPPLIATPPGRYRHYKGMLYDVVGTVRHSETLAPMTLYRALYGEHGLCSGGDAGQSYLRLWPHRHSTDGFFAAVWERS